MSSSKWFNYLLRMRSGLIKLDGDFVPKLGVFGVLGVHGE